MAHILVIEDEPGLRVLLVRLLSRDGYQVSTASTGSAGLQAALKVEHDLVLLDLALPDLPGEDVLQVLLAAQPHASVLVLSSVQDVNRRAHVLDAGAEDFVAKPFVNTELMARIRLRIRTGPRSRAAAHDRVVGGGFELDMQRRGLVFEDEWIELSKREFVLLAHLIHRQGEVCTRQELLADVWGIGFDPGTNLVDVYVRRLRKKLTANAIETVRNVGYRLSAS